MVSGVNIFIFFFLLAAQFAGMASLLKFSFGIGFQSAAIISCVIVIFVPATFLALIKDNVQKYRVSALWSIIVGFIANLFFFVWGIIAPHQFEPKSSFIPGFISALLVLLIGIRFTKRVQEKL